MRLRSRTCSPDGRNFSDLNGVCHKSECRCDAVTKRAVGMYNKPMGQHPVTWHNQTAMWKQIEDMSGNLNGNWYVTPEGGQCTANQILGSGDCFWKFQGVQRTINATCLNNRLRDNVLAANPACWKVLPQPSNRSADGWSECLLATITGKAIGSAPAPAKVPPPLCCSVSHPSKPKAVFCSCYAVVSVPRCVLPYAYSKLLRMLFNPMALSFRCSVHRR